MSKLKINNLNPKPAPFFARYLEAQYSEELSAEQQRAICGGSMVTTLKAPSDHEDVPEMRMPPLTHLWDQLGKLPDILSTPSKPGNEPRYVTNMYPSDNESVPEVIKL